MLRVTAPWSLQQEQEVRDDAARCGGTIILAKLLTPMWNDGRPVCRLQ